MFGYDLEIENVNVDSLTEVEDKILADIINDDSEIDAYCDIWWNMLSDFGKCLYITHCPEWDDDQIQYMENYIEFWNEQHDDCETSDDLEWLFEKLAVESGFYCKEIEPYLNNENMEEC